MTLYIDCLRHGEIIGGSKYRGVTDEPLTQHGWASMENRLQGQQWDQVITSPLQRCSDFADHYAKDQNIPLLTNKQFQEYDFGDWDGLSVTEIEDNGQGDLLNAFWLKPYDNIPPNAEQLTAFHQRIQQAWRALIRKSKSTSVSTKEQRILLITHAGVIHALVSHVLAIPPSHQMQMAIPHASLTGFRIDFHKEEYHVCLQYLGLT